MPTKSALTLSIRGTLTKTNGEWEIELPVIQFKSSCAGIVACLQITEGFFQKYSTDPTAKYSFKIMDTGVLLVSSSNYQDFVGIVTHIIIQNPNPEDFMKELISGIVVELE